MTAITMLVPLAIAAPVTGSLTVQWSSQNCLRLPPYPGVLCSTAPQCIRHPSMVIFPPTRMSISIQVLRKRPPLGGACITCIPRPTASPCSTFAPRDLSQPGSRYTASQVTSRAMSARMQSIHCALGSGLISAGFSTWWPCARSATAAAWKAGKFNSGSPVIGPAI